jgi:hypothetical protein
VSVYCDDCKYFSGDAWVPLCDKPEVLETKVEYFRYPIKTVEHYFVSHELRNKNSDCRHYQKKVSILGLLKKMISRLGKIIKNEQRRSSTTH